MIQRKNIKEIIEKLLKNKLHIILGYPGSGKTVLARNIAFLFHGKMEIYFLELRKVNTYGLRDICNELAIISKSGGNCLVVLENIHNYIYSFLDIIKHCRNNYKNIHILATSRLKELILDKDDEHINLSSLLSNSDYTTSIMAKDIANDIIQLFSMAKNVYFNEKDINKLKLTASNDLWMLAYQLSSNTKEDEESFKIENVYCYIKSNLLLMNEIHGYDTTTIIKILSTLGRFCIPVTQQFLIYTMGMSEKTLRSLAKSGCIKRSETYFEMYHESLSNIFYEAYKYFSDLSPNITPENILKNYFLRDSPYPPWVLSGLAFKYQGLGGEDKILGKIIQDRQFREKIEKLIKNSDLRGEIENIIYAVFVADEDFAKELVAKYYLKEENDIEDYMNLLAFNRDLRGAQFPETTFEDFLSGVND